MPTKQRTTAGVYQLKVTLKGSKPPIWRRFQVAGDITLYNLHEVLQIVMGWSGYHLHQFTIDGQYYGEPDPQSWVRIVNEKRVKLNSVVFDEKTRFTYEYDFGDDWEHRVLVEKILPPEPGKRDPVCLKGKRACPPEDCGGIWGYDELLQAIANPSNPEHGEMLDWVGGDFDPEEFDLDGINRLLARLETKSRTVG